MIARADKKPYTRRLLPDFLIPGCVIRLDNAYEAYKVSSLHLDIEHACSTMLCIDERTARKHLSRLDAAVRQASLILAGTIAHQPEFGDLPKTTPDITPLAVLANLLEAARLAGLRSGKMTPSQGILFHIQKIRWEFYLKRPSGCVVPKPLPP